jgi:cytochrome c-type biogenesis protein CcmH/NrfF
MLIWLRSTLQGRRWVRWAALLVAILIAYVIVVSLLPRHVVNTLQTLEEQSNGVLQTPRGPRTSAP